MFDGYVYSACIGSKNLKLKSFNYYPNYNAKYNLQNIKLNSDDIKFYIPILNDYICYNPTLENIVQSNEPTKLDLTNFLSFYYGDIKYRIPQVEIKIIVKLPQLLESINVYTNILIFYSSAYNSIIKIKDLMLNAGYDFYFKMNIDSIYISISGYTENIIKAIKIIKYLFSQKFSQENYNQAIYELEQGFKNFTYDTVISKFATFSQEKIFKTFFMPDKILKELKNISMGETIKIYNNKVKTGIISIFCSGNVNMEFAKKIMNKIYKYINITHYHNVEYNNLLEYKENQMFIYKKSNKDINILVGLLFPLPEFSLLNTDDWYNYIIFSRLFEVILGNDFYYELRTEKEIGYVVKIKSSIYDNNFKQKIYLKFIVQSSKYKYEIVLQEILNFIKRQEKRILNELSEIDYKEFIQSEKNKLKRDFDTISDLTNYYFNSIIDKSYKFNSREILINKIDSFTLDVFRSFFEKYIIKNIKLCFVV